MKVKIKFKILSVGVFPMHGFQLDGFIFEYEKIDENKLTINEDDDIFYKSIDLMRNLYTIDGKQGNFADFFKSETFHEIKVSKKAMGDKKILHYEITTKSLAIVSKFERKLRLITNQHIIFPVVSINAFNEKNEILLQTNSAKSHLYIKNTAMFTEEEKSQQNRRFKFNINSKNIEEIENQNVRFKRAIDFFNASFSINDIEIRFVLLMSAFESLFLLNKNENISSTIAKYTSKIMFRSHENELKIYNTMKKLYDERSLYLHGRKSGRINIDLEFYLREYLREVLIIYWFICYSYKFENSRQVRDFLDSGKKLDLINQMFIETLRADEYKDFYKKVYADFMDGNFNIVEKYND